MQFKKLTIGIACAFGLTIAPMVSQAGIITLGDGSQYDISLQSHVGNTWTYSVSEVSGKSLSHWNLGIPSCIEHITDYSPTQGYDTTDGSTDFEGIKWDVDESFTSGTFSITLDADYPETTILAQAKAGPKGNERTGNVKGPDCDSGPVVVDKCDYTYAVHDDGLNDTQILRYKPENGIELLQALGKLDIEAIDISPKEEFIGASGDDGRNPGSLYVIDMTDGTILSENPTGCTEIDGISFNPADGKLWAWDQDQGLVEIVDGTCLGSTVPNDNGYEIEDLTWDNAGETLYFAYNDHGGADPDEGNDGSATHKIGKYSEANGVVWDVCEIAAPEIEALEMLDDNKLLLGYHNNGRQLTEMVDLATCNTTGGVETAYDIEGIAVCLCPSTSIAGTWNLSLDISCNGNKKTATLNYSDNLTWNVSGFPNRGPWTQNNCSVNMTDSSLNPNPIWTGTIRKDGSLSGTVSGLSVDICWTATRVTSTRSALRATETTEGESQNLLQP